MPKQYNPEYHQENKEKRKVYMKKWQNENKEYLCKYMKKYRKEHSENIKEYKKQWDKDNSENNLKYYIENRGRINTYHREWIKTEKGKANSQRCHSKRRVKEGEIINTLTAQEWEDILEEHNYVCAYCGVEFNCELLPTKDHVIPITKGGHNTKENVVPACKSCNSTKYNKLNYAGVI